MIKVTPRTWVVSDTHWGHSNIAKYANRPDDHFERMFNNWNEVVGENDTLLHLGDLTCYGDEKKHAGFLKGLKGKKYLLRGNHDKHENEWYEEHGFEVVGREPFLWTYTERNSEETVAFSHEPITPYMWEPWFGTFDVNIHGHIHTNPWPFGTDVATHYINVSIEQTDYYPVRMVDAISGKAGQLFEPSMPLSEYR